MAIRRLVNGFHRTLSKDNDNGVQNAELVQGTLNPTPNQLATTFPQSSHSVSPKSSSVSPSNTVSQSNVIPKNILAFRLITKMLYRIPHTQPFISIDNLGGNNNWMSQDRQEVKISDAFAHLAITEHGTAAIATNHCSSNLTLEEPANLSIIACTTLSSISEGSMKATPNVSFLGKMWNIMLAKNARNDDPKCLHPTIIPPDEPSNFSNFRDLNAYMKNLEENW